MMIHFTKNDIPLDIAIAAHQGTSYTPEKRGKQEQRSYADHITSVVEEFEQFATDENREELAQALQDYRQGYLKKKIAYLNARSRIVSQLITGRGGWTSSQVRSHRKKNETADKRFTELIEWSKARRKKLHQQFNPTAIARAPIRSDDDDAIAKLKEKIEKAVSAQEKMKTVNKICRRKIDNKKKIEAMVEIGFSVSQARELLAPDFAGRIGFASYVLSNNNANIRRMKKRIERLEAEAKRRLSTPDEYEINGVTVIENDDADRLQIIFDDKPSRATRDALKSRGFRWAPSQGAWQRLLNNNARRAAKEVLG